MCSILKKNIILGLQITGILLALQETAGLLVLMEELHGVHIWHCHFTGKKTISFDSRHCLDIVICNCCLCPEAYGHLLPNTNNDPFPGHLWELMWLMDVNLPTIEKVVCDKFSVFCAFWIKPN